MSPLIIAFAIPLVAAVILLIMPGWKSFIVAFAIFAIPLIWLGWPTGGTVDVLLLALIITSAVVLVLAGVAKVLMLMGRAKKLQSLVRTSWRAPSVRGRND